jgi:hypothetical protein
MYHLTTMTDDRIDDLRRTAAELRAGRAGAGDSPIRHLRIRIGTTFLAVGAALVSGAHPATASRAGQ